MTYSVSALQFARYSVSDPELAQRQVRTIVAAIHRRQLMKLEQRISDSPDDKKTGGGPRVQKLVKEFIDCMTNSSRDVGNAHLVFEADDKRRQMLYKMLRNDALQGDEFLPVPALAWSHTGVKVGCKPDFILRRGQQRFAIKLYQTNTSDAPERVGAMCCNVMREAISFSGHHSTATNLFDPGTEALFADVLNDSFYNADPDADAAGNALRVTASSLYTLCSEIDNGF